jgi:hypothetical protein
LSRNNDFDPIFVDAVKHDIGHLKDLQLVFDVRFSNGDIRPITVHIRPTNHLFSREVKDEDYSIKAVLEANGYWLKSYVHNEGNYQSVKGSPATLKEHRIFCHEKWGDSFYFPQFVKLLGEKPAQTTVLANAGEEKTCLSGFWEISSRPDYVYLIFFTLTKINSKELNMLIESAYCVSKLTHGKARRLLESSPDDAKPFIIVLQNIQEGRKPLEGQKKSKRSHKMKKKKLKSQ